LGEILVEHFDLLDAGDFFAFGREPNREIGLLVAHALYLRMLRRRATATRALRATRVLRLIVDHLADEILEAHLCLGMGDRAARWNEFILVARLDRDEIVAEQPRGRDLRD